jgi:hypothetical protein|tara:strand:- start:3681 stop:3893 length:213 start_codon:yes stop_codon:yes gene_type:complete
MIIEYCDLELDIDFSYEAGEKQTFSYFGSSDKVHIEGVNVKGVDIFDLLDLEQLNDIETIILEKTDRLYE